MNNEGGEGLVINNKLQCSSSNRPEPGDVGFCGGRKKTGEPGEKSSKKGENQQQIEPTWGAGGELRGI